MSLALSPTLENAPRVQILPHQPFSDSPSSDDYSALEFVLVLLAVIIIPALIYAFFFAIKCPPNPFRRTFRCSYYFSTGDIETPNSNNNRETFSDFKYKKETHLKDAGIECPVCLSVFSDGEEVKQLSTCKHSFHKSCIDIWLNAHSNCPVCRASVSVKRSVDNQNNTNNRLSNRGDDDFHQSLPDAANLV